MPASETLESPAPRYVSWPLRGAALVVDYALFCAVFFPVTRIVKGVWLMTPQDHRWAAGWVVFDPLCLIFLIVIFAYFIVLEGLTGATLGKALCGIRVVAVGGGRPGLRRSLVRNLLRMVDGLPMLNIIGIVLIATSVERTRFGDIHAGTRVVRVRPAPASATIVSEENSRSLQ